MPAIDMQTAISIYVGVVTTCLIPWVIRVERRLTRLITIREIEDGQVIENTARLERIDARVLLLEQQTHLQTGQ